MQNPDVLAFGIVVSFGRFEISEVGSEEVSSKECCRGRRLFWMIEFRTVVEHRFPLVTHVSGSSDVDSDLLSPTIVNLAVRLHVGRANSYYVWQLIK